VLGPGNWLIRIINLFNKTYKLIYLIIRVFVYSFIHW
jgi:hypothetical protein